MTLDLAALRRALRGRTSRPLDTSRLAPQMVPAAGLRPAAALVPLLVRADEACVLLTVRRADLRHHAGQVSFPGGRIEAGERAWEAALREAHEEVGLDPAHVELLGPLDEILVLGSGHRLSPWVGLAPAEPYPYVAHPAEVDRLVYAPLEELRRPGVHRVEDHQVYGKTYGVHFYELPTATVWGATARVLHQLLGLIPDEGVAP